MLMENGPCYVNSDSNSTRLNPNSWNNEVNMLYIDQPVQVGFSYDTLVNITHDILTGATRRMPADEPVPEQNSTFLVGTYPSLNPNNTARGSRNAAMAIWEFAQVWFQEFPEYHPNDARISISTQSCKLSGHGLRVSSPHTPTEALTRPQTVGGTGPPLQPISWNRMRRSKAALGLHHPASNSSSTSTPCCSSTPASTDRCSGRHTHRWPTTTRTASSS